MNSLFGIYQKSIKVLTQQCAVKQTYFEGAVKTTQQDEIYSFQLTDALKRLSGFMNLPNNQLILLARTKKQ